VGEKQKLIPSPARSSEDQANPNVIVLTHYKCIHSSLRELHLEIDGC
jgi:hypothetical protein